MLTFWEQLELLCKDKGVTPKVMAIRICIKECTMNNWKYKGDIPRWETLVKLAEYFHVPREHFIDYRKKLLNRATAVKPE